MSGSGFKDFANGVPLTEGDLDGYLMKQTVMYFATAAARTSGIASPEEGMVTYRADDDVIEFYDGASWVEVGGSGTSLDPTSASVATNQSTTSTSFTDLATAGPAVTATTDTEALVVIRARMYNSGVGRLCTMGFAVSGASTVAASDVDSVSSGPFTNANDGMRAGVVVHVSGLTPGSNTFTCKYKANADTAIFEDRVITVIPL